MEPVINNDFAMRRRLQKSAQQDMMNKEGNMLRILETSNRVIAEGDMQNKRMLLLAEAANFEKAKEEYEQAKKNLTYTNQAM